MTATVAIIHTEVANTASVLAAFSRLGAAARLTTAAAEVAAASHVVLPGVGSFGPGMERLRQLDLVGPLCERIRSGRRTLAICLGIQLLCAESEEAPGVPGLGILDASVRRFPETVWVPQLGWNEVQAPAESQVLQSGAAYFANSYRLSSAPPGWIAAVTDHGGPFVSAVERGAVVACQFHPELSGAYGAGALQRWLEAEETPC